MWTVQALQDANQADGGMSLLLKSDQLELSCSIVLTRVEFDGALKSALHALLGAPRVFVNAVWTGDDDQGTCHITVLMHRSIEQESAAAI